MLLLTLRDVAAGGYIVCDLFQRTFPLLRYAFLVFFVSAPEAARESRKYGDVLQ